MASPRILLCVATPTAASAGSPSASPQYSLHLSSSKLGYHIADTKGIFYTREPCVNVDAVHVTRFLRLASVGNKDKQECIVSSTFYLNGLCICLINFVLRSKAALFPAT
ncbi:hypothetical protein CDL15_Pgr020849 [Punica granatum]|uniref:Uncharacterized protein n=1 Tax=Punica granatum TaxID=22663 RepID=A0A218XUQ8_PUNGR|nr:hypothetical protein CDL15_Pgr020849 [Punica granatum]